MLNFETVKYFTAEGYEKERFADAVSRYQVDTVQSSTFSIHPNNFSYKLAWPLPYHWPHWGLKNAWIAAWKWRVAKRPCRNAAAMSMQRFVLVDCKWETLSLFFHTLANFMLL
jgi:hypothetical protein